MPNGIGKKIKNIGISKSPAYKKCLSQGGRFVNGKCKMSDLASRHDEKSKIRTGKKKYVDKPKRVDHYSKRTLDRNVYHRD